MGFAHALNFTSSNEDGATELEALRLTPTDHVLCLTASGGRVLDLLLGDPRRITALDLNAAQNALLALKIAAIRTLEADDLYGYLGVIPCSRRLDLHARVEAALTAPQRTFWARRSGTIRSGVWLSGRWERVLRLGAWATRLARGRDVDALFAAPDLSAQATIWAERFDDRLWRSAIRLLSQRWVWTRIVGEPGGAFLPPASVCEARLADAFVRASRNILFRRSDFAWLVFRGRHDLDALPLHLRRENLPTIRERLDRVHIVHGGLHQLAELSLGPFDAFSLSDFSSYCDQTAYEACWRSVVGSAASGARVCERSFMNTLAPPASVATCILAETDRGLRLSSSDAAIIYDVRCGTLIGAS